MGRHLLSILMLMSSGLQSGAVLAYPAPVDFDGSIMRWDIGPDDPPITFEVKADLQSDVDDFYTAVVDAADLWSGISNSYFRYGEVEEGDVAQVTVNLNRTIDGSAVSSGYAIFDAYQNKKPSHCSIFILVDDGFSQNSVAKTILHELGHCVGLGHSPIPEAIMSYQLAKNQFALDIDDEAAVTRLYPASGDEPKLPPGCSIGLVPRKGSLGEMALLLIPMWVGLLLSRRDFRLDR